MYIVFDILDAFKNSAVGNARIVKNLAHAFLKGGAPFDKFVILRAEEEIPEGNVKAKLEQDKIILENGSVFGIARINLEKAHLITFEPDNHYEVFHTGYAREIPLKNINHDEVKETAFLIWSTKEGPKNWVRATFNNSTLDFGEEIDACPLN